MNQLIFKSTTLGIRHRRSFRIPSITGEIIDEIINDPQSPFSKEVYSTTQPIIDSNGDLRGRILLSDETGQSLAIDTDNVILVVSEKDLATSAKTIKETYVNYVTKNIFGKYSILNINRLGFLVEYEIKGNENITKKMLEAITNGVYSKADFFSLKFNEKMNDELSFVNKEYYDYQNNILMIEKNEQGIYLKYDFQIYCRPEVERVSDLDIVKFIQSAQEFVQSRFIDMIKKYEL